MSAPTIDELLVADDGERWAELGFTVSDGCCELGQVRLRFLPDASARGIVGWSLRDVASTELDGLLLPSARSPATNLVIYPANRPDDARFEVLGAELIR